MKTIKLITLLAIFVGFSSCSDDDDGPVVLQVESDSVMNFHAPQVSDYTTNPPSYTGEFKKFDFSTGMATTSATEWDIAFRGTSIIVNGGVSFGATDEPARNGNAAAYFATGTLAGIASVNTSSFEQDSVNGYVLSNWYDYNPVNHIITPTAGKIFVVKTRDGKYAKLEILSYYKDAPATNEITEDIATNDSRYFTFNYVYQPNEGVTTF